MGRPPGRLTLSEDDRRILAPWAAACAERSLMLFESAAPGDPRPGDAITGAHAFGRGELRIGQARALAVAAHAAARDTDDPAAVAAARAAGHAVATAHMAAHARGAPAYAAIALALAHPDDPAIVDREITRASERATSDVRSALFRLPPPTAGGGRLGALIRRLHELLEARADPL